MRKRLNGIGGWVSQGQFVKEKRIAEKRRESIRLLEANIKLSQAQLESLPAKITEKEHGDD